MSNVVRPLRWLDSFTNFLAGFGVVGRDKMVHQKFVLDLLGPSELENAYRSDWLVWPLGA